MTKPIKHSKEPSFQVAWACLHLVGAVMHFGSAIYHVRKIRSSDNGEG